jgi:hypothetical protein
MFINHRNDDDDAVDSPGPALEHSKVCTLYDFGHMTYKYGPIFKVLKYGSTYPGA